jgi:hypothetical protein
MKAKKAKRRELVDMDFDEGLARLIQTKPEEVKLAPGKKRKKAKVKSWPTPKNPN